MAAGKKDEDEEETRSYTQEDLEAKTHGYEGPGQTVADVTERVGRQVDSWLGGDPDTYRERTEATKARNAANVDSGGDNDNQGQSEKPAETPETPETEASKETESSGPPKITMPKPPKTSMEGVYSGYDRLRETMGRKRKSKGHETLTKGRKKK